MTERKTVVTLHKGVDSDRFLEDMTSKHGTSHIPERAVPVYNEKKESVSNFDFILTMEEADHLRFDPRVRGVRWGTKKECGIVIIGHAFRPVGQYPRLATPDPFHLPWAIPAMLFDSNPYVGTNLLSFEMGYTADGTGVDVVISDDGLNYNHPELLDDEGNTRVQLINWPTEANMPASIQSSSYYDVQTRGHGMHCASSVAGRTYGWAPKAEVYNMVSLESPVAFGASESLNLIKNWHLLKGTGRPTVVNASWGYFRNWSPNKEYHVYRGVQYDTSAVRPDQGMVDPELHPDRVTSIDSDVEDLIAAGVHFVSSAGNNSYKVDIEGGADYDNSYRLLEEFTDYYWHRGSSPAAADGAINVGAIDYLDPDAQEKIVFFTNVGPGIDLFAPGAEIQGALDNGGLYDTLVGQPYGPDTNFRCGKLNGSSFAAPQVAGVLACYLQLNPTATPEQAAAWIKRVAVKGRLADPTTSDADYEVPEALLGAPNAYAVQPYRSAYPLQFAGGVSYIPI